MYAAQRSAIVQELQRTYGNFYVQRVVDRISRMRAEALQTKLVVGPAGDEYEREADRVAKHVVGMTEATGEAPAQRQEIEEEELQTKPLQRQIGAEGGDTGPEVEQAIQQAKSGGQAIPEKVRAPMEEAFGTDFSGVRVHTGSQVDALNQSLSARAFTTWPDIFVRGQDYNPESAGGKELLAHELTHVVQQGAAEVRRQGAEEEELVQTAPALQRHTIDNAPPPPPEEEEVVQAQRLLQRQTIPGEELAAGPAIRPRGGIPGHFGAYASLDRRASGGGQAAAWGVAQRQGVKDLVKGFEGKAAEQEAEQTYAKFVSDGPYTNPDFTIGNNGKFDVSYQPAANRVDINVRVKFTFPEDTPAVGETDEQKAARETELKDYRNKFLTHVTDQWSDRYTFKNVREPQAVFD